MSEPLSSLFLCFRDRGDVRALAKVFDRTAPELAMVAAHLARSPHDAEDLVQSTFLAAIEGAAGYDANRPLMPWLLGILSMQARKQRERSRRVVDAGRVAQESPPDPLQEVESAELRRAVESAVARLDARYAGIVRRHLLDGAAPAALASEFGLSGITARVRLHRGIRRLRKLLPASLAGAAFAAATWRLDLSAIRERVLSRALERPGATLPASPLISTGLAALLLAPVALAAPIWIGWRALRPSTSAAPSTIAAELLASAPPSSPPVAVEPEPDPRARSTVHRGAATEHAARIRGRLLLPSGAPAIGATITLQGRLARPELAPDFEPSPTSVDAEPATAAADGRFEILTEAPNGFRFLLQVVCAGAATARWGMDDLAPDTERDLGDVVLEPAGSIVARILDTQGTPLGAGWGVTATTEAPDGRLGREVVLQPSTADAASTTFRIEGVAARRVTLEATHVAGERLEELPFDVVANQVNLVDFVYRGPDLGRRITVKLRSPRPLPHLSPPEHVWIERAGAAAVQASPVPGRMGTFVADDLAPGNYRVRIEDPRLEPWSRDDVRPGEVISADVRGNAALRLVLGNPDQTPYVGRYRLAVVSWEREPVSWRPPLIAGYENPPSEGRIEGLWPRRWEFELRTPTSAPLRFAVDGLTASETREVAVTLGCGTTISGTVLDVDGTTPLANVDVQLTRGRNAGHLMGIRGTIENSLQGAIPPITARTTTAADGGFAFAGLDAGDWTVRVAWSRWLVVDRTLELPCGTPTTFVRPEAGRFAGRLLLPEAAPIADVALDLALVPGGSFPSLMQLPVAPDLVSVDGAFDLGPLPIGPVRASMLLRSIVNDGLGPGEAWIGQDLGEFTVQAGAAVPVEIDLRATFPARLHGTVSIDGALAREGRVRARRASGESGTAWDLAVQPDGAYSIPSILCGTAYEITYTSRQGWSWTLPQSVTVPAGADAEVPIAFATIEREVQVVDASTLAPIPGQRVGWRTGGDASASSDNPWVFQQPTTTDGDGKFRVRLPCGAARPVALASHSGASAGTFAPALLDWTSPGETIVLKLTR